MAKRSSPALYEMMRNRGATPSVPSISPLRQAAPVPREEEIEVMRDDASPSPVLERLLSLLSPGRSIRVPVGYLLMSCGAILLLLVAVYILGVSAGKSIQTAAYHEKFGEDFDLSPRRAGVNDPLTHEEQDAGVLSVPSSSGGEAAATAAGPATAGVSTIGGRPPREWGPVAPAADPRRKGWNYFIAAETTTAGAVRLAEFCRSHGLETYVVPAKNGSRVIVFPGFQGPRDAPAVQALEERIHQVGDKYKAANRYETNMRDAYPAKYDG